MNKEDLFKEFKDLSKESEKSILILIALTVREILTVMKKYPEDQLSNLFKHYK